MSDPNEKQQNAGETPALPEPVARHHPAVNPRQPPSPSLTPSFPLSSKETGRVVPNVVSPEPHRGWHSRGYLPHWDHPGMIQSLNFRLGDAMAQEVLDRWKNELGLVNPAGSAGVSPASYRRVELEPAGRDAGAPRQA